MSWSGPVHLTAAGQPKSHLYQWLPYAGKWTDGMGTIKMQTRRLMRYAAWGLAQHFTAALIFTAQKTCQRLVQSGVGIKKQCNSRALRNTLLPVKVQKLWPHFFLGKLILCLPKSHLVGWFQVGYSSWSMLLDVSSYQALWDGHVATMHLHEKQIQFHNQADYTWGHNKIGRMLLITVKNSSRCNYIVVIVVLKHPRGNWKGNNFGRLHLFPIRIPLMTTQSWAACFFV